MAERTITGKQAAMLRAKCYEAGLKFDQQILEWIEYETLVKREFRRVEGIEQQYFGAILEALEKREA